VLKRLSFTKVGVQTQSVAAPGVAP